MESKALEYIENMKSNEIIDITKLEDFIRKDLENKDEEIEIYRQEINNLKEELKEKGFFF